MTKTRNPQNVRILLVDDEDFVRRVLRQVLMGLGYTQIIEEPDGLRAIECLRTIRVDLILTDVQMPGMNGLELLKRIRRGETGASPDSRVLVITSFSNSEVLGVAMALDVNGFLVKPMTPANVDERLATALAVNFQACKAEKYAAVVTRPKSIADDGRAEDDDLEDSANASIPRSEAKPAVEVVAPKHFISPEAPWLEVPDGARRVLAWQLRAGMVLCEELRLTDGTLILSARHTLTENTVNRLSELRTLLPEELLWVQVPDNSK